MQRDKLADFYLFFILHIDHDSAIPKGDYYTYTYMHIYVLIWQLTDF
jgi:hypothetical protein